MKQKAITCALFIIISAILGSISLISTGCKTKEQIQIIQPSVVSTNNAPYKAFNDETYVWENFYFSTNQVKETSYSKK